MKGFKFNKVYIIESLNSNIEKQTGKELFNDLLKWKQYQLKDFNSELFQVNDKKDFFEKIDKIKDDCTVLGYYPIIHFEIHGDSQKSGLVLNSGELIKWKDLYEHLIEINTIVGNNLFLTMAVCNGAFIMELIKIEKPAPFWGFIGSFDPIEESDILIRYNKFYDSFLTDFNLNKATDQLHKANPNIPSKYRYINSEETFVNVYKSYLKERFTEEEIKERFKDGLKQENIKITDRNELHNYRIKFKIQLLKTKKEYFEEHRDIFFMTKIFPENKKRFSISYNQINNAS